MSSLHLSPAHVAAFAQYREALALCRRFGNIARFRARALRDRLEPLGLVRCGDRFLHLGDGEFEGFVLTPPARQGGAIGQSPEYAGFVLFGGVCLQGGLMHRAELRQPDVPELQVGFLLQPMAAFWPRMSEMLAETLHGLEAEGFERHSFAEGGADADMQALLDELKAGEALLAEIDAESGHTDADEDADFDLAEPGTETWVDIEDDDSDDNPAGVGKDPAPGRLLLLRRLPLDRLPERCGPIVTRFFTSALAPLAAIADFEWELLLMARDQRMELGEEE